MDFAQLPGGTPGLELAGGLFAMLDHPGQLAAGAYLITGLTSCHGEERSDEAISNRET